MKRLTYEFVAEEFKKRGFTLLSTEYINKKQKLDYICPNGHRGTTSWDSFQQGNGCIICSRNKNYKKIVSILKKNSDKKRLSIEPVRKEFEDFGYTLLSTKYKNNQTKLECICPKGHRGTTTYKSFHKHHSCKRCVQLEAGKKAWAKIGKKTIQEVREAFANRGYTLLSTEYTGSKDPLEFICPEGHRWHMQYNSFQQGRGCRICSQKLNHSKTYPISHSEQYLFDFIHTKFKDAISNDRKIITPYELDIVIPSKKLAIEYCGIYWHSEKCGKDRKYHLDKLENCNKKGYDLITIFEDEFLNQKEVVLSRLKNILGISDAEKVYARKCVIKEIDSKTKNRFLKKFHLQGNDKSRIKLGAFYKDSLVSVMTFSKPSIAKGRKDEEGVYELNRFCSDTSVNVIGGASRLFSYFVKHYTPKEVYSYADRRWSTGNLYKVLGFDFISSTDPNYWYIVNNSRIHRFNFRKSVLHKKLDKFDDDLSEVDNMRNNGFTRIWDCGSLKFVKYFK